MSRGYFPERKNCTEHDYAIFRTIERFLAQKWSRACFGAFFGDFLDFLRVNFVFKC